jgi:diadenosine tetraphosphate (Ap4A) HIT family hydrolase
VVREVESALREFCNYERINYLMLMMVDPHVHFHVIPRYSASRQWEGTAFQDGGWPGPPQLKIAVELDSDQVSRMRTQLKRLF